MAKDTGICEHCQRHLDYALIHNGFNDSAYAYCDTCGCTAVISGWSPKPQQAMLRVHQRIDTEIEDYLERCQCGGHFSAKASPRCPFCKNELSASAATTWIEANAQGTSKGWRWQQSWSGIYCVVVQGCVARNPWRPELLPPVVEHTVTLFRPVGPDELRLIEQAGFHAFPPRLPEQPIFYPVLTEEYAEKIAREWNVPASGGGFVTRFKVRREFLSKYEIHNVGGERFQEYWIPADDLAEFNRNIVGAIEVVQRFSRGD
jgi:hypothetical protein